MPNDFDDDDFCNDPVECSHCGRQYDAEEHSCCPECSHRESDSAAARYSSDVITASNYSFSAAVAVPTARLRMGYELETTSSVGTPTAVARTPLNTAFSTLRQEFPFANSYCITKSDASIRGPNPAEIVTIPLSVPEHARVLYKAFPEGRVGGRHLQCWSNESCGFHIHAGLWSPPSADGNATRSVSQLDVGKLLLFVNDPRNERFWSELCGRGACNYARFRRSGASDYGRWVKGHRQSDINGRVTTMTEFQKYDALNVTPGRTLEFRLPRPTARIKSLLKNLELFESAIKWVKFRSVGVPFVYHDYLEWLAEPENRKVYTYLHDWLKRRSGKYAAIYRAHL